MKSNNFRKFDPNCFIIPLIHFAKVNHISHIHRNVTTMELRSNFPTTVDTTEWAIIIDLTVYHNTVWVSKLLITDQVLTTLPHFNLRYSSRRDVLWFQQEKIVDNITTATFSEPSIIISYVGTFLITFIYLSAWCLWCKFGHENDKRCDLETNSWYDDRDFSSELLQASNWNKSSLLHY